MNERTEETVELDIPSIVPTEGADGTDAVAYVQAEGEVAKAEEIAEV